jgi:hypothetical protein
MNGCRVEVPTEAEPLPATMTKGRVGSPRACEPRDKDLRIAVKSIVGCRHEHLAVWLAHRLNRVKTGQHPERHAGDAALTETGVEAKRRGVGRRHEREREHYGHQAGSAGPHRAHVSTISQE